jgi:dTDP-4-dehydrorhamnose 3,5-epimerase
MRFIPLDIEGAFLIEATPARDDRGSFARVYCPEAFAAAGIKFTSDQINLSANHVRGTLRGLHFQDPPYAEAKLVRAVRGRAFDVIVDLRTESPTYRRWVGLGIDAESINAVFVPEGCAHGFLTLADETDILYQMGRSHVAGKGRGYRWDDPAFGISWPEAVRVISETDRNWPPFEVA